MRSIDLFGLRQSGGIAFLRQNDERMKIDMTRKPFSVINWDGDYIVLKTGDEKNHKGANLTLFNKKTRIWELYLGEII